jgi:hypothetical protein
LMQPPDEATGWDWWHSRVGDCFEQYRERLAEAFGEIEE